MNIFYWSQLNCLPAACLPQLPASCKPFTFRYSQLTNIVFLPAGTQSSQLTRLLSIIGPAGKCRKQLPLTWHLFNKRFNMLKMSFLGTCQGETPNPPRDLRESPQFFSFCPTEFISFIDHCFETYYTHLCDCSQVKTQFSIFSKMATRHQRWPPEAHANDP